MKRKTIVLSTAAAALLVGVAAFSSAPTFAHGYGGYGGYGMMQNHGYQMGHHMMRYGKGSCGHNLQAGPDGKLGVDEVKAFMESRLERRGNDRLKVGKVEARGDTSIIAEIVTVDDSLVRTVEFDTRTGFHGPMH